MQRTQIYLTEEQIQRLDALADERGATRSDVIREIVDDALAAQTIGKTFYQALREVGPLELEGIEAARAQMWGGWEQRMAKTRTTLRASRKRRK